MLPSMRGRASIHSPSSPVKPMEFKNLRPACGLFFGAVGMIGLGEQRAIAGRAGGAAGGAAEARLRRWPFGPFRGWPLEPARTLRGAQGKLQDFSAVDGVGSRVDCPGHHGWPAPPAANFFRARPLATLQTLPNRPQNQLCRRSQIGCFQAPHFILLIHFHHARIFIIIVRLSGLRGAPCAAKPGFKDRAAPPNFKRRQ